MKTRFTFLLLFTAFLFTGNAQQLPNNSFDSWTVDTLAPDGWSNYESLFGFPLGLSSKDAVDKVVGPYSLKITSDSVPGQPSYGVLSGLTALGEGSMGMQGPSFPGIAFPYRPDTLFVVYKYTSPGADTPLIAMQLMKGDTAIVGHPIYGVTFAFPPSSAWATGYIDFTSFYTRPGTPDTLSLQFYSSKNPAPNGGIKGSVLHVDGILFGYASLPNALRELADKLHLNVYPNPASDVLTISSEEPVDGFTLMVNDLSGRLISITELGGTRNSLNVTQLDNGVYTYRLADKTGNILKQDRFNVAR